MSHEFEDEDTIEFVRVDDANDELLFGSDDHYRDDESDDDVTSVLG